MPTDNRTLLEKADLALADLSTAGLLQPQQAAQFIRIMIKRSVMLGQVRVRPMKGPTELLEKINFGSRIMRPGAENTALAVADRSKPDLSKVTLNAVLIKGEVRFSDETMEDQIERGNFGNTLRDEAGKAVGRDVEELLVQGDTGSADTYLALFDGVLAAATSNVVAAGGIKLQKSILRDMLKAMPSEFLQRDQLRYYTSVDAVIDYGDYLSDRGTGLGDSQLTGQSAGRIGYGGVGIQDVQLFPENLGMGADQTNALLVHPKNIIVGIHREIKIERDRLVREGSNLFVITARVDFKYEHEPAVVKATGILVG